MKTYTKEDFEKLPSRYKARFFNSLSGFKPISLIGTKSAQGIENVAPFSRFVHIGARPPYIGVIFRPHSVRRDTLENIRETKSFTINHVHENIVKQAHHAAAKFDQGVSEFDKVGLTAEYGGMPAPYVKEAKIKIGLHLAEEQRITVNDTILVVGSVVEVQLNEQLVKEDGFIDLVAAGSMASSNVDAYYNVSKHSRFDYPQPDAPVIDLPKKRF